MPSSSWLISTTSTAEQHAQPRQRGSGGVGCNPLCHGTLTFSIPAQHPSIGARAGRVVRENPYREDRRTNFDLLRNDSSTPIF
jgi:hypothetical protein